MSPCAVCNAPLVTYADNGETACSEDAAHDVDGSELDDEFPPCDADELLAAADECVASIGKALDRLVEIGAALVDRDSLVVVLRDLRDLLTEKDKRTGEEPKARQTVKFLEERLLNECGERTFDTPFGRVEVRQSTSRSKWQHDDLIPRLIAKANEERRLNASTGEVESEGVTVARVLRECISFGAGKVTGLRARGINPDEFAEVGTTTYSISVPPRSAA